MARQNLVGMVISQGKMNKTIKVRVQSLIYNSRINKDVMSRSDFVVHDEANVCKEGDVVRIEACRPLSSSKRFAVAQIKSNKGQEWVNYMKEAPIMVAQQEQEKIRLFNQAREHRIAETGKTVLDKLRLIEAFELGKASNEVGDAQKAQEQEINQYKQELGIKSWGEDSYKIKLGLDKLKAEAEAQKLKVKVLEFIQNQPGKTNEILTSLSKNPQDIKLNIKVNILKKYFSQTGLEL
ncbi:nucleic acid-binding protein [Nadsonia fulvescens var. elongata DSM 6958]|uniref:Nucleic acid-binding protein n=1 Tax=Nadsonia fulvescens var. elongata DSM 6958 TaxID=857566 RepID=A0A1E3PTA0_9ASCO|nr:nucleic acid-binding protein [Nadsonia fulvescens var. elongata DSM 6958]